MIKNFKVMYNDIINNRSLQDNIPNFLNITADKYNTTAAVRLALHYYTYYEMYWDEKDNWQSQLLDLTKRTNTIIFDTLFQKISSESLDKYIDQLADIRKSITETTEILTSYVDAFETYEYALNRVEYRFEEIGAMEDDEEFTKKVLRHIFKSKDNVYVNESIKDTIGQLPVRITKHKYFGYINDSLQELLGAHEDVLETQLYIVRSSAMLDITEDIKDVYHMLWERKEKLEGLNFKDITKEEYDDAALLVRDTAKFLQAETTAYFSLVEIVNELYTILLCAPHTGKSLQVDKKEEEASFYIIRSINEMFLKNKLDEPVQEILNRFKILEGFQEEIEFDLASLEDLLYHVNEHQRPLVNEMKKEKQLNALLISKNLISGNLFIELDTGKANGIVDKKRLRSEIDGLINELTDKFQDMDRMIIRAIMAKTMDKIPVFFNSHTEIMEYILYSLNKCTDLAEKYACMDIIEKEIEFWETHTNF